MSFIRSQPEEEKVEPVVEEKVEQNKKTNQKGKEEKKQKPKVEQETKKEEVVEKEQKPSEKELYYLNLAQRVQAEFDNYRKRTRESETEARERGIKYAVENLLPIMDTIQNAKTMLKDEASLKSVQVIENQVLKCFDNIGVHKIDALNQPFDPNLHNAILTGDDSNYPSDTVLEVYQEGFKLNDKVIRHSVVKVNK